jgi:hypothetical protein
MIADSAQLGKTEAARQILANFAKRAYRRPVTDEELNRLVSDVGSAVLSPSARWAIFVASHFIVVAFEW